MLLTDKYEELIFAFPCTKRLQFLDNVYFLSTIFQHTACIHQILIKSKILHVAIKTIATARQFYHRKHNLP